MFIKVVFYDETRGAFKYFFVFFTSPQKAGVVNTNRVNRNQGLRIVRCIKIDHQKTPECIPYLLDMVHIYTFYISRCHYQIKLRQKIEAINPRRTKDVLKIMNMNSYATYEIHTLFIISC